MPRFVYKFPANILPDGGRRMPSGLCAAAVALVGGLALAQGAAAEAPARIGGQAVVEASAVWAHSCTRVENGPVWCRGYNSCGALGDGTTELRRVPVRVRNN